jgi:hypothetical protein
MAHFVYAQRETFGEEADVSAFGLKTWWLTNETSIVALSNDLIKKERASYLMRPDFLLHFITFLPRRNAKDGLYRKLFPCLLGVHLVREDEPENITRLHDFVREAQGYEPARQRALIAERVNQIKGSLLAPSFVYGRGGSKLIS